MGPFASLFKSNARKKGSEAVEEAIAGFEDIIQDLNDALERASEEFIVANEIVLQAEAEKKYIGSVMAKGENFLKGLKTLLQS